MEKEPTYLSREQKFSKLVSERFSLWSSTIDDSAISPEIKEKLKHNLGHFQSDALTAWQNLDDAFYFTISIILRTSEEDKNKNEANALFENLRDDIWDLYREIKN